MTLIGPHVLRGLDGLDSGSSNKGDSTFTIRQGDDKETILTTLGSRVAARFNLSDSAGGGLSRTWFAPSFMPLTSAVVAFSDNNNIAEEKETKTSYAAVLAHTSLITWDGAETKLEKIQPVKLKARVSDLIEDEDSNCCYVAFQSGHIQTLSYVMENPSYEGEDILILPSGSSLEQTSLMSHAGCLYAIHTFCKNKKQREKSFAAFRLTMDPDSGAVTLQEVAVAAQEEREGCLSLGVVLTTDGPTVIFVDGDSLFREPLLMGRGNKCKIVRLEGIKVNDRLSVASSEPDFLGVAGERKDAKGSVFHLVSLNFSAVIASVDVQGSMDPGCDLAYCGRSRFFLKVDGKVTQVSTSDLPCSLDSMIGRLYASSATKSKNEKEKRDFQLISESGEDKIRYLGEVTGAMRLYEKMPALFEKHDVSSIERILEEEPDIPELLLLSIIEFLLLLPDERFATASSRSSPSPICTQVLREKLLSKAFNVPITEPLMVQYLGQVEFAVALKMLQFLDLALKLESSGEHHTEECARYVDWTSMVLNSHYSNILITKDETAVDLLASLSGTVATFESGCVGFASLMPLVRLIKEKKLETRSYANKAYCIEVINL